MQIRLGCCAPAVYAPNGTTLIHSFMCEKSGKALTREEVSLWKMKAKEQKPAIRRWSSVNLLPPKYESDYWEPTDDDGGIEIEDVI